MAMWNRGLWCMVCKAMTYCPDKLPLHNSVYANARSPCVMKNILPFFDSYVAREIYFDLSFLPLQYWFESCSVTNLQCVLQNVGRNLKF